jgi:hypothetical protein
MTMPPRDPRTQGRQTAGLLAIVAVAVALMVLLFVPFFSGINTQLFGCSHLTPPGGATGHCVAALWTRSFLPAARARETRAGLQPSGAADRPNDRYPRSAVGATLKPMTMPPTRAGRAHRAARRVDALTAAPST